jgi:thiol-disulfide isomerase/thioredoxin
MTRITPGLLFAALFLLGACASTDTSELENRVAELEKQMESLQPKKPVAAEAAQAAPQDDQAARVLLAEGQALVREGKRDEGLAKLNECKEQFGRTRTGARCAAVAAETELIGSEAKPIQVATWVQGNAKLESSEATLIVFWETWCPHCKREVPKLEAIHNSWKGKGVQVVGLTKGSRGTTEDQIRAFVDEHKLTYPVGIEEQGAVSRDYIVRGVPAAAFVGSDGKIKWRGHPAELNDQRIQELLSS